MRRSVGSFDWSATPLGPMESWPAALRTAVGICLDSPLPMFVWWGPDLVNIHNDAYAPVLGARHPAALGRPAREIWAEIWPQIGEDAVRVLERGVPVIKERVRFVLERDGHPEETFFTYAHSPIPDDSGGIGGLIQVCSDETARVRAEQERQRLLLALENERSKLAAIVQQAPAFICTLVGPEHVFEFANDRYYEIVGRRDLIGKTLREALPEIADQGYHEIIDRVYCTGEPFSANEMPVRLERPGEPPALHYINVAWQALRRADGAITGVFVHGVDVTDGVRAREAVVASEARLRTSEERLAFAIGAGDLGTFYCPMPMGRIVWNDKCKEHFWLPPDADIDFDLFYALLHPEDREATRVSVEKAIFKREPYDVEYRTVAADGRIRWVHAKGRAYYDAEVNPTRFDGVTIDVTAQKRAEAAIAASEARFRELADSMPQIVWAAGPDGVLDYYNRRWFEYIGVRGDADADAVAWAQYVHPDDLAPVGEAWRLSLASGEGYQVEFRVRAGPTGTYRWFLVRAEAIRSAAGAIVRWYGTCTDIEDRKRAEARDQFLLLLDESARPLTDPAQVTATHARLLGEHLDADRCAYADVEPDQDTFNLTGDYTRGVPSIVGRYRFADFGQTCLRLMRADEPYVVDDVDTLGLPADTLAAYRATMIRSVICIPLCKGGRLVAAMAVHAALPRRWSGDEVRLVQRVAARCWESIERARVGRSLRESERRFRDMADTAPAILWVTEADGTCSFLSRGWYELTGQTEETGLGFGWVDAAHPDDRAAARDAFVAASAAQQAYAVDFRLRQVDGTYRWVIDAGRPRFDPAGRFLGFIGSIIDITDRKRAEEERQTLFDLERSARMEADRASRMKDEFLATLSHELRTPLSAILGWSQVLRRPNAKPEVLAQGLDTIERNARAQTQIIEDLLDMSRIISGKILLNADRVDLGAIVRAAIETVGAAANAKSIALTFDADATRRFPLSGDANRLQQVFWNLLSNAIKFTPRGGVVGVRIEQRHSLWQVDVTDSGEGITEAFLPHVFERFRQQDGSTTRRHGGLGLGLAIVKQLVELHGGTVRVASDGQGKGATFTVSLPVSAVHGEPTSDGGPDRSQDAAPSTDVLPTESSPRGAVAWNASACDDLAGATVLIVDDEPDARALLLRLLTDCNARVLVATTTDEAIELLQRERPDVLVSDIGMPGEDGYGLLRRVRALGKTRGGDVPAIALTAYARAEDRVKAIRAGFQMHVPKPVEPAELITMVATLAGRGNVRNEV